MSRLHAHRSLALLLVAAAAACHDDPLSVANSTPAEAPQLQSNVAGSPNDRDAIQRIVNTFDASWSSGDYVTYASQYAGAEWVGPDGTIETDPSVLTQTYQFVITDLLAGTTRQSIVRNLTFLTGTIAVLDIDTRVTGPIPPFIVPWQPGIIRALEKNLLVKRGNEWRIMQHQQLLVAPGVP